MLNFFPKIFPGPLLLEPVDIETLHQLPKMSDSLHVVVVPSPFASLASLYEVDPDADALLIVPPSSQKFAPWDVATPPQHSQVNGIVSKHSTAAAAPASRPGLRIKVSSKHLALSSKIFKNKLQFGASKAARQSDGRLHLQLAEGFDPKAVSIVLNTVHGRGSKVPKSVDLETLAQIALFVDRFQLFDAVEVYGDRWISKLEGNLPEAYNRDLILWIYVSHVFRNAEVFKAVSRTAVAGSDGPIKTLGLPIREKVISKRYRPAQSPVQSRTNTIQETSTSNAKPSSPKPLPSCTKLSTSSPPARPPAPNTTATPFSSASSSKPSTPAVSYGLAQKNPSTASVSTLSCTQFREPSRAKAAVLQSTATSGVTLALPTVSMVLIKTSITTLPETEGHQESAPASTEERAAQLLLKRLQSQSRGADTLTRTPARRESWFGGLMTWTPWKTK